VAGDFGTVGGNEKLGRGCRKFAKTGACWKGVKVIQDWQQDENLGRALRGP